MAASPLIAAGAISALGSVALDCSAGGTVTGARMGFAAARKGLEMVTGFSQGATDRALEARFSNEDDYREVQAGHELAMVLHRAVIHVMLRIADRSEASGDTRSSEALRFVAENGGGVFKPMEGLDLVDLFATTSAVLREPGGDAEGGVEPLTKAQWQGVVDHYVMRVKRTRRWVTNKHRLAPRTVAELVDALHIEFPGAVRNVVARDEPALAKLVLLMLGETLAQVRHLRAETSGVATAQIRDAESRIALEVEAFERSLKDEVRRELGSVLMRFDHLAATVRREHRTTRSHVSSEAERTRRHVSDELRAFGERQRGPVPSLAPTMRTEHFMGREGTMAEALSALDSHRVVFVCGPGGIGKSALARHLHGESRQRLWAADGADYIDLSSHDMAVGAVGEIAQRLGLTEVRDASGLIATLERRGRRLYILDDLQQAYDNDYASTLTFLRALTANASPARVLVTMRSRPDVPNPTLVEPGRLDPPHDAVLFRTLAADHRWTAADDEPLEALLRELNGHPLSIVLVAGHLRRNGTVADLLTAWRENPLRVARRAGLRDHSQEDSLAVSLGFSYDALERFSLEARALFVVFADLPAGASGDMLSTLGSVDEAETLVRLGLLHKEGERTAALVPVRHFAASKRAAVPGADVLRAKLRTYIHDFTCGAEDRYQWARDDGTILRSVRREIPNIYAALDRAKEAGDSLSVATAVHGIRKVLMWQPDRRQSIRIVADAIRQAEAHSLTEIMSDLHHACGEMFRMMSEYDNARNHYVSSLNMSKIADYEIGEAYVYMSLGFMMFMKSEYDNAIDMFTKARDKFSDLDDTLGLAGAELGLGQTLFELGMAEDAQSKLALSEVLYRRVGDRLGEANAKKALGVLHIDLQNFGRAGALLDESLDLYIRIENILGVAFTWSAIGRLEQAMGDTAAAYAAWRRALGRLEDIGLADTPWVESIRREADLIRSGRVDTGDHHF